MDRLQDISRLLLAAGGTPSRDGKTTHLTYEKEGSIRMRTWTGSELADDELITDEARRGTSAPIVNRSRKKVFVVHKNDSIKCFIDPLRDDDQVEEDEMNDDAPWNEEEIIGVDTRVHPQSQLAVSYDKNTVFIFYQKPDGSLSGINEYNDKWKAIELPTVAALNGTPLATCNTNSAVFLFYMSVDGTVRYIENSEGEWKDVFFSSAEIIDPDEKLPGTALKLTIAEDRQAFERIRPLVFCLDNASPEQNEAYSKLKKLGQKRLKLKKPEMARLKQMEKKMISVLLQKMSQKKPIQKVQKKKVAQKEELQKKPKQILLKLKKVKMKRIKLRKLDAKRLKLKRFRMKRFKVKRFKMKRFKMKRFKTKRFKTKRFKTKKLRPRELKSRKFKMKKLRPRELKTLKKMMPNQKNLKLKCLKLENLEPRDRNQGTLNAKKSDQ
ncbi:hypothetical protein TASIC1_0005033600 [Trichoderma asperellum]|uniref:Fucose-specific lectin n=1 Tax=Trichoderma asperellum TaxID=101201 RepID=A0A6V8QX27_TRIAP|nr:hypothetical protein TASIC1_0005033600 [Trichoderma asperellum]